jgi:hypothetical protein
MNRGGNDAFMEAKLLGKTELFTQKIKTVINNRSSTNTRAVFKRKDRRFT